MVSASFPNRPFNLRDEVWLIGQDVANNRSLMGFRLWIDKRSYSPTWSAGGITHRWMRLDGGYVLEIYNNGFDFRNGTNFLIGGYGEAWVYHNADGTKWMSIEAAANYDILGSTSLSTGFGLPTIPRASTPSIAAPYDRNIGSSITINTNRASTSFTHTLSYSFAGASGTIAGGVGDSYAWTPPLSLLNQIPNATSAVVTITCDTYSGGTYVGTKSSQFTLTASGTVIPTISSLTVADQNSSVVSIVGALVQNLSVLRATVNAAGVYSSTIQASSWSMAGSTVASGSDIPISGSGTVPLTAATTDSRNRTGTWAGSVPVLAYTPPTITTVQVRRSTSGGVVDLEGGTSLRVDLNAFVKSLINTTERNNLTVRVFTRARGTSPWTARNVITQAALTYNSNFVVSGGANYPVNGAYEVQVQVQDKFVTATAQIDIATGAVFMHWSSTGVGIGTYHNRGTLDVKGDIYSDAAIHSATLDTTGLASFGAVATGGLLLRPDTGTTTERDAYYGTPTTDAQKVALANLRVRWYNTTTNQEETYYAVTGTTGLSAPGLLAGSAAGWYVTPGADWAGKSGPNAYVSAYCTQWSRGINNPATGRTVDAILYPSGILIRMTGLYEVAAHMRGGGNSGNYISLALNGDRVTFEERSNPVSPAVMEGVWDHDHPAALYAFTESNYIGKLYAGDIITAGPPFSGTDIQFGSAASQGSLVVKRFA